MYVTTPFVSARWSYASSSDPPATDWAEAAADSGSKDLVVSYPPNLMIIKGD